MKTNKLQEIAKYLENELPKGHGFVLLTYNHNEENGRLHYVSNSKRNDVVNAMEEFIEQTKGNFGAHKI